MSDRSGPSRPTNPAELRRLLSRLEEAEAAVVAAMRGQVDAVVDSSGHSYLLREAQQALVRSEARAKEQAALLRAIFENAPDVVLYLGCDGRVRYANKVAAERLGRDVVGADWSTRARPESPATLTALFEEVVRSGEPARFEGPVKGVDGATRYLSDRLGAVRQDGEVVGVVVITRDITEQKKTETQLMLSDRMASVGTLAAGVAHEINNPLTAVSVNLDVGLHELGALEVGVVSDDALEALRDAREAAEHIRTIVRDLRLFSRSEDEVRGPVDVERVLDSTARMAWNEVRHRARLVKDYAGVPRVEGNESRLAQVFLNLLVNAAQALPEGSASRHVIHVTTSFAAVGRVAVEIADTGPGIPPDVQSRIFTPFFTTKPAGMGTGLGLAICHRIVTAFGGQISFRSGPEGTTFRVELPIARVEPAVAVGRSILPPATRRRGRLLVVEDELALSRAIRRIVGQEHEVVVVDSGVLALARLREDPLGFDVVLCDLMMPEMTGMDLFAEASRIDPANAARFVFMTGGAFTPRAQEFLESVANHRVEKPFDPQQLRGIVNELVSA